MSFLSTSAAAFLAASAAAVGLTPTSLDAQRTPAGVATQDTTLRPFRVNIPEAQLADLRRRIAATRWPDKEAVDDQSQEIKLVKLKPLVESWGTGYDWRKAEAKLNAYPQLITNIDGVDIHFIHVRSKQSNALPVSITHGWPGSVLEQHGDEKVILIGLVAKTCIESTGRFAMELGDHVILVTDATAAFSLDMMHAAHKLNGPTQAHEFLTTAELIAPLEAGATPAA